MKGAPFRKRLVDMARQVFIGVVRATLTALLVRTFTALLGIE